MPESAEWIFLCSSCQARLDALARKTVLWIDKHKDNRVTARVCCTNCGCEDDYAAGETARDVYWFLFWSQAQTRFYTIERFLVLLLGTWLAFPFLALFRFLREDEIRCWADAGKLNEIVGSETRLEKTRTLANMLQIDQPAPFFPKTNETKRKV